MSYKLSAVFDNMLHWSQLMSTGNNHFRLDVTERLGQMSQRDVMEITKRRPNWHKELEQAFEIIQDALDPINEIECVIEEILAEREN